MIFLTSMNIDYSTNTLSFDTEKAASPPRQRRALRSPNRPKVLAAARERFATQGYMGTTIAQIAGDVGVDQALVIRLFGSKIDLFDACLEIPEGMVERFRTALKAPLQEQAEHITKAWFLAWEDPTSGPQLRAMYLSAATSASASDRLHRLMEGGLLEEILPKQHITPTMRAQAAAIGVQLLGAVAGRYVFQFKPLTTLSLNDYVKMISPGIQAQILPLLQEVQEAC